MRRFFGFICGLFFVSLLLVVPGKAFDLKHQVETYKQRYMLMDIDTKLTDNQGEGYDNLYGTRNLRAVLHGVYYRGGGNNAFSKIEKRPNINPLPDGGLYNLCQEGFSEAIYLYTENFETAPPFTQCVAGKVPNYLNYRQLSGLRTGNERQLMTTILEHIRGVKPGPVYAHCWNGWHSSGYVAAISLQQFCGWTPSAARAYWVRNTDGNSVGYSAVERRVLEFVPFEDLKISAYEQSLICPQ